MSTFFNRTLLAVIVVLSLVAAVHSNTLAESGGNSSAAAACESGGYVNFADDTGARFENTGQCVSYAAQGNALRPFQITQPVLMIIYDWDGVSHNGVITLTGSGLKPDSPITTITTFPDHYQMDPLTAYRGHTDSSGGFFWSHPFSCGAFLLVELVGVAPDGTTVSTTLAPPCSAPET